MKRKLLALILSVAVMIAFVPSGVFAKATIDGKADSDSVVNSTKTYKHIKTKTKGIPKYTIKIADTDFDEIRQEVVEYLQEYYGLVKDEDRYNPDVYKEIKTIYDSEMEFINSSTSVEDITTQGLFGLTLTERTGMALEMIEILSDYTLRNGYSDLPTVISESKNRTKDVFSAYKKADYNTYYWEIISSKKDEFLESFDKIPNADSEINKLYSGLTGYAECALIESEMREYAPDGYFEDEDDGFEVVIYVGEEGADYFDLLYDHWVYSNEDLKQGRMSAFESLKSFAYELEDLYAEKNPKDKKGLKKLKKENEEFLLDIDSKMDKAYTAEDILEIIDEAYEYMYQESVEIEKLDEKVQPTYGDVIRLQTAIDDLAQNYIKTNYSEKKWAEIESLFDEEMYRAADSLTYTKEQAATKETRKAARDEYVLSIKKKADKILNKIQEPYYNKLAKAYKGKAKYDKNKVSKLLAKASDELSKYTSKSDLKKVYDTYKAKLDKALSEFKITTSVKGKGTISPTKKVQYGKNYTVKFKAKKGYKIQSVKVDGKKVSKRKIKKSSYTFKNVKKAHKIVVTFVKK